MSISSEVQQTVRNIRLTKEQEEEDEDDATVDAHWAPVADHKEDYEGEDTKLRCGEDTPCYGEGACPGDHGGGIGRGIIWWGSQYADVGAHDDVLSEGV